jgi:hypothetical protein
MVHNVPVTVQDAIALVMMLDQVDYTSRKNIFDRDHTLVKVREYLANALHKRHLDEWDALVSAVSATTTDMLRKLESLVDDMYEKLVEETLKSAMHECRWPKSNQLDWSDDDKVRFLIENKPTVSQDVVQKDLLFRARSAAENYALTTRYLSSAMVTVLGYCGKAVSESKLLQLGFLGILQMRIQVPGPQDVDRAAFNIFLLPDMDKIVEAFAEAYSAEHPTATA